MRFMLVSHRAGKFHQASFDPREPDLLQIYCSNRCFLLLQVAWKRLPESQSEKQIKSLFVHPNRLHRQHF